MSKRKDIPTQTDELKKLIFVAPHPDEFFKVFDQIAEGEPREISSLATVFRSNLQSAMDTAAMPFYLTAMNIRYSTASLHFTLTGESVDFEEVEEDETYQYIETEAWGTRMIELASREDIYPSLVEHLRQSTVLLWGTFEAFSKDLFATLLNVKPDLTVKLMDNPTTRRILDLKTLRFDDLAEYNYNLSNKMGDFLSKRRSIDSFITIKEVFSTILPISNVTRETLSEKDLRLLNYRRHLIVHRRSIVDREYLDNTKEQLELGTELIVTSHDFNSYLYSVLRTGTALVYEARSLFVTLPFKLARKPENH